jgi:surface protein
MCDIGKSDKCKSCSDVVGECGQCNDGFELSGGKCIIKDYDVLAEYETTEDNVYLQLMNSDYIEFIEVDGESIVFYSYISQIFIEKKGTHIIKFKLREYTSFAGLFNNNPYLKSIIFFENFDSSWIYYMNDCFANCPNLEYADLSKLDLSNNHCFMNFFKNDKKLKEVHFPEKAIENVNYLYGMFQNCESLTSVDISSFSNSKVHSVESMFDGCTNLRSIKIGGLKNTIISNNRFIYNLPSSGNITLSKEYKNLLEDKIPENWVVEVDDPNYKKTILIAGDSTAESNGGNDGETEGWGKYLGNYLSFEVNNLAFLGESARSFYRDGRWKNLIKKVVKGDYVFIQFGHFDDGDISNNPKSAVDGIGNETVTIKVNGVNETVHTFTWYIRYFANQVLVKGATPVLLSLTPDFKFTDGKIAESNKYQGYMKTVAEDLKIPYIDLYNYIKKNYESFGEQYLKNNNWFPSDTIHTSPEAANFNAKMVITAIKCQKIEDLIDNINSEGNTIGYPCLDDN